MDAANTRPTTDKVPARIRECLGFAIFFSWDEYDRSLAEGSRAAAGGLPAAGRAAGGDTKNCLPRHNMYIGTHTTY